MPHRHFASALSEDCQVPGPASQGHATRQLSIHVAEAWSDVVLNDRNPGRARIGQLALSVVVLLLSAGPPVLTERLPIRTYATADGLAHNIVNRIVRDSRGFLWFCTAEGLSRFDGYRFTTFGVRVDH